MAEIWHNKWKITDTFLSLWFPRISIGSRSPLISLYLPGDYPYMDDLLCLEMGTLTKAGVNLLDKLSKATVTSPLDWRVWNEALLEYPDRRFREYITTGLRDGFKIGFQGTRGCRPARTNMRSAAENTEIVSRYLQEECSFGRVCGPFSKGLSDTGLMISHFGVIPKGFWRVVASTTG